MKWLCSLLLVYDVLLFFFFKQKTAYEMRISDWSSDVCSSDLNSYGEWFCEDKVHSGKHGFTPMPLEEFKASGTLQIMTPDAAVAMFRDLQSRMPLDHYMFSMPDRKSVV